MVENQEKRTWQHDLIVRHPALFRTENGDQTRTPGYPTCGDGWQDLVERACVRIQAALDAAPGASLRIGQVKEKFARIRIYLDGAFGLPDDVRAAINSAIDLAEARSACTCETCGAVGRLFNHQGYYLTACDDHAKGDPVPEKPVSWRDIRIVRRRVDGKVRIVSCRRYDRETDTFTDVDPSSLGIKE